MSDPVIAVAGRAWRVPPLAPRQNRIVLPALLKLETPPDYALLLEIAIAALGRAQPEFDASEFEDAPVPLYELLDALPTIAQQTGFLERRSRKPIPAKAEISPGNLLPDFDALIAEFVNCLPGTTWDDWEDALTGARLRAMREEWRKHPPLPLLAAAWLGYRPPARTEDAADELLRLFPDGKLRLN